MQKRARVELLGTNALTITETRALIKAALNNLPDVPLGERFKVEDACEKLGFGLVLAGQDEEAVRKLFDSGDVHE